MNHGTGHGDETQSGCLDIAALDALATQIAGAPERSVAAHLESCERCRSILEEMRSANRFLEQFRSGAAAAESAMPPEAGTVRVPGYETQDLIGFGGQGAVFRAIQAGTSRTVAIKVPIRNVFRRPATKYRFQREIELTARLDHPGIVRVIGPCELADGRIGCVMEYIEGQPFDVWAEARRREGRGSVRRIVRVGAQVADAIAYAHQRAVLHRDIKPSNVVVTDVDTPRVLDFGLAKALDDSAESFATQTGAFIGTLSYAAPEQIGPGADSIDMRTDVYGLGLLLYQALTGRLPHSAEASAEEVLRQIREVPPPRPSSFVPDIGNDLDAILLMALAKERDRRYASAAEFRDDLVAWLDGRAVRARLDSRWYAMRKSLVRHRLPVAIVAASLLGLTGAATLGLIAREQANRATLANAVRDARVLESHWARLSEARSTAIDNFETGERAAWDALLDPEPALLETGIEGVRGEAVPSSPVCWAHWEIYQRTPIVFTAPTTGRQLAVWDPREANLLTANLDAAHLDWWDYRTGQHLRTFPVPKLIDSAVFAISPDGETAIACNGAGPAVLVDLPSGESAALPGSDRAVSARLSDDRAIVCSDVDPARSEVVLWDVSLAPPTELARYSLRGRVGSLLFDASRRSFAAATYAGELLTADAATGERIYSRSADEAPRFVAIHSRGVSDEFILYGPEAIAVVDAREPRAGIDSAERRTGFLEGVRSIATANNSVRYVVSTDRFRAGIGDQRLPLAEGFLLPSISASGIALSDEGHRLVMNLRPSGRIAVLDLEPGGTRRLPFPAPVISSRGFATIFDVEFDALNRSLLTGAMDGSLRSFHTAGGDPPEPVYTPTERGVTAIRTLGSATFVGTHDMGRNDAVVVRLDAEGSHTLLAGQRWICGMEIERDQSLWILTGGNQLHRLDPGSGKTLGHTTLERNRDASTRALVRIADLGLLLVGPAADGLVILEEQTLEPVGPSVATPAIRRIAVSPADPTLIATTADDGMIRLWRLRPGPPVTLEPLSTFGAHAGATFGLAFSPDGRFLASGGGTPESKDIRLWDVEHGRELAALDLFELGVFDLAWSPDGRWIAAGGEIRLEHPAEGGQLYLVDRQAPDRCIAGNLEYHIARFTAEHGHEPSQAAVLRRWAATVLRRPD